MIKFVFIAHNGESGRELTVQLPFQPGNQTQRARRLAVGELLAQLESTRATVDASADDMVVVSIGSENWIIAESKGAGDSRGAI